MFIADEVQTGFARTGDLFACDHEGVVPDLIVTAKGIAGGLPLAAVTGRTELMDAPHAGGLGGTYGGNPLACAAALAVFETIEADGLVDRAREIGTTLLGRLAELQAADPRIGDVRGRGAMVAVELVDPRRASRTRRWPSAWPRPPTPRASSSSPAAPGATCCACSRRSRSATRCSRKGST